jgi:hypothetical protein
MSTKISRRAAALGATLAAMAPHKAWCQCAAATSGLLGCAGATVRALSAQGGGQRPMSVADFNRWAAATPQSIDGGNLDRAFGGAVSALARFSGQRPDIILYDGEDIPHSAFANPLSRFANTSGTVIVHKAKLRELLDDPYMDGNGDVAVMVILAHEFAHIAQFNSPYHDRLLQAASCNVLLAELQADYMAGFYLAELKRHDPRIDSRFAVWLMTSIADRLPGGEHGMSEHRLAAASAGYDVGAGGERVYATAMAEGADFVQQNFAGLVRDLIAREAHSQ